MKQNESEFNTQIDEKEINKKNSIENSNVQTESDQIDPVSNNPPSQLSDNIINESINQNTTESNISENIENNNIIVNNLENNNDIINNNNINNIDNINNQINSNSINLPEIEQEQKIYDPKLTFSFKLFLTLNILAYIHSNFKSYKLKNFSLCLYPIFYKNQYYRLITSHFYNYSFFDYCLTMIAFFFATKYLEREIGSMYVILIIFHALIITSILYITFMWLSKFLIKYTEYNFTFQCGFSSIDFCLFLSYFLLEKNYRRNISLSFLDFRGVYSVYFVILVFQLITPSASLILNLCGTLSAFLVFNILKYISLPRNYWIGDFEKLLGLNKKKNCEFKEFLGYFSINENDAIINNIKELDYFLDNKNKVKNDNTEN